jgi:hydrogenase maturation protease
MVERQDFQRNGRVAMPDPSTVQSACVSQESPAQGSDVDLRILAIGSSHGDDRAGWEAADLLSRRRGLEHRVFKLASPVEIIGHLQVADVVILLDACTSGRTPGAVQRVQPDDLPNKSLGRRSTHGMSVAEAVSMSTALNTNSPTVTVFAIEIEHASPGAAISAAVARGIERLAEAVIAELESEGIAREGTIPAAAPNAAST